MYPTGFHPKLETGTDSYFSRNKVAIGLADYAKILAWTYRP